MKTHMPLVLASLAVACTTQASIINIALHNGGVTVGAFDTEGDGSLVSAGTNGSDTWNNIQNSGGVGPSFSSVALAFDNGSPSGAMISGVSGYTGYNNNGWGGSGDDHVMMEGWYGFREAESLTVSGLPPTFTDGGYRVVVYGDSDSTGRTMNYTLGGTTRTIYDSGTFSGTFTEGVNLVTFMGLTNSSFTITGNSVAIPGRSAINGIRIISSIHQDPPVVESFVADDYYVAPGETVVLDWSVSNATHVAIDQGIGDVSALTTDAMGSTSVVVDAVTTYTLTATNSGGSTTASLRVGTGPERPNIVLFLVDDMGTQDTSEPFQVDGGGNDVPSTLNSRYITPNMQTLAGQGMKFTHAYAMPVCTPSRCSIMTGQNAVRHHVTNWTSPNYNGETGSNSTPSHNSPLDWLRSGLGAVSPTLPQLLGGAGYRCIHAGKAHFGNAGHNKDPLSIGFDVNIGGKETGHPGSYYGTANFGSGQYQVPHLQAYHGQDIFLTEALTLEMNKAIGNAVSNGVPFFAYMTHYAVHAPFQSDPRFTANYPTLSGHALAFATMIEGMDKSLGDIMAKLDALGVAEDTLVIFLSDNGSDSPVGSAPLRGKKGQKYEGGSRVPMIVGWAKVNGTNAFQTALSIPIDSYESDMVTCFDMYPTILGVANVTYSNQVDGHDLGPYLRAESGVHRPQELVIHFPHDHNSDYYTFFREGEYKLIYNYASDSFELYNVVSDIGESTDLAASDPDRVMAMARKMAQALDAHGAQWPTFDSSPDYDDPFAMPVLAGVDLDDDGIDDNAEDPNGNGLVDPGETDPDNNNSDGDGTGDGDEVRTGTDPLDPSSDFVGEWVSDGAGIFTATWPSAPGALYEIQTTDDLAHWIHPPIATGIPASDPGATTSYVVPASGDVRRFYRIILLP